VTDARIERPHSAGTGIALIIGGVGSIQFGAAFAATLFDRVGPIAVVTLRLAVAAVVLVAIQRPALRARSGRTLAVPVGLGVVMAVMNTSLYEAIDRLPLGVAITLEFLGPVAVALASSRRWIDAVLALTAALGVVLLTGGVHDLNFTGVAFALSAAACWSLYILLNRSLGSRQPDGGLAIAALTAAIVTIPVALARVGTDIFQTRVLLIGVAVGVLCSVIPYMTDMLALRRLPVGLFSVLMSLHPATAALAGFIVLDESLSTVQGLGIALVIATSATATLIRNRQRPPI
jgi:inner membrane transporter RhtA